MFKFFNPRTPISQAVDVQSKCKSLCSRSILFLLCVVECCVYQFESLCRGEKLSVNEQKKKQNLRRHLLQCFNRLVEMLGEGEVVN